MYINVLFFIKTACRILLNNKKDRILKMWTSKSFKTKKIRLWLKKGIFNQNFLTNQKKKWWKENLWFYKYFNPTQFALDLYTSESNIYKKIIVGKFLAIEKMFFIIKKWNQ